MKKVYNSPKIDSLTILQCGIICGLSGTDDSGSDIGTTTPGKEVGTNAAPGRVF